jgi:excinuclease ABC subunit B
VNGKAILYADRETGSMKRAIEETARRRTKQQSFNEEHGITPKGLDKKVTDIMEGAVPGSRGKQKARKVAESSPDYEVSVKSMTPGEIQKEIIRLEDEMYRAAKELEFERAAQIRDELVKLKQHILIE